MYSQGSGEDGDQEDKAQQAHTSHPGINESVADSTHQFQDQGARTQTIPVADIQQHTGYSLSDICREQILIYGLIPHLHARQIMNRGPQSAVAQTQTTVAPTPRMTNIPRQANHSAEENSMGQTHKIHSSIPIGYPTSTQGRKAIRRVYIVGTPGGSSMQRQAETAVPKHPAGTTARARRREATQQVGPPVQGVGSPNATGTKQRVAAKLPEHGTLIWKIPSGAKITFIPATETETIQHHEPETNEAKFNPAQQQETSYAIQQNFSAPTEDDRALKVGTSYAQPSTSASGEDQQDTPIYELHKGVQGDQSKVQEHHNKQDSALPGSRQTQHAPRSAEKLLSVPQVSKIVHPVSNITDRPRASIPPQQETKMRTADSSSDFPDPATSYVQDKNTQVNIGLVQQDDSPVQNPDDGPVQNTNNAEIGNTPSYNNSATNSGMPSTAGERFEGPQRESSFSLHDRLTAEEEPIYKRFVLDPNICSILIPAASSIFSDWIPVDDVGMQQLGRSLKSVKYLLTKETTRHSSGKRTWQAKTSAGDMPADRNAPDCERKESNGIGNKISMRPCICNVDHRNKEGEVINSNPAHIHTSNLGSAVGSNLGLAQHGEDHSSGGSSLLQGRQGSLGSSKNSGVTCSCGADTNLETTPSALHQQRQTSEEHRGHKRHSDPNELSPPAAKKPELQLVPSSSTSFFPQTNETDPLSLKQETTHDAESSGALSVNNGNILSCAATDEYPDETITFSQKLHNMSSDHEKAETYFGYDSESEETSHNEKVCHLELDKTETQVAENENEGEYDGGAYMTDIIEKQLIAEEQEIDFSYDVPQTDEEKFNSEEHENESDTDRDSELPKQRDVLGGFSSIQIIASISKEMKLTYQSIRNRHYKVEMQPSTSHRTPMFQIRQLQKRHGTRVESELIVETQYEEDTNNFSAQPRGSVGKKYEMDGTPRNNLNTASSEPPITSNLQMGIGQETVTEDSGVLWAPIKHEVKDYNTEEESDNLDEEKDIECQLAGKEDKNLNNDVDYNELTKNEQVRCYIIFKAQEITTTGHNEDNSSSEIVNYQSEDNNMDNDVDYNDVIEIKPIRGYVTLIVKETATTGHNEDNSSSEIADSQSEDNNMDNDVDYNELNENEPVRGYITFKVEEITTTGHNEDDSSNEIANYQSEDNNMGNDVDYNERTENEPVRGYITFKVKEITTTGHNEDNSSSEIANYQSEDNNMDNDVDYNKRTENEPVPSYIKFTEDDITTSGQSDNNSSCKMATY